VKCFTIGYGGRRPDDFVALLQKHGVVTVVDVRLRPDRASMGIYTQAKSSEKGIQGLLAKSGIQYISLLELGNVFRDMEDWRQRYRRLVVQAGAVLLERLWSVPLPFCLMCAEQRVQDCHRLVLAEYLEGKGWEVEHVE
jgi:uncharacterized protein (DUF488 family)